MRSRQLANQGKTAIPTCVNLRKYIGKVYSGCFQTAKIIKVHLPSPGHHLSGIPFFFPDADGEIQFSHL